MKTATGYRDLVEGEQYKLEVRIVDCQHSSKEKRAFEMTVADRHGTEFEFIVWEKSPEGRSYSWTVGEWYRLSGVSVNEWETGKILHGAKSLGIKHLGEAPFGERTELLYMTDSHLGKAKHGYGTSKWRIDPEAGFESAIDLAVERGVDAVLHGGDIFHNDADGIGQEEREAFEKGVKRLVEADIPFYFIYGNHEQDDGRAVLKPYCRSDGVTHLDAEPTQFDERVTLYGWDHDEAWSRTETAPNHSDETVPVVLLHQSVTPFSGTSSPDAELTRLAADLPRQAALLVGHSHVWSKEELSGRLLLSGGATARLGGTENALAPSAELLTVSDHGVSSERLELRSDALAARGRPR